MRVVGVGSWRIGLRVLLVAALLYGGLWPFIDIAFIAHCFPLPFVTGAAFFRGYSHMVGGPVQYAAGLFSQAYSRHWAGVLALTLLALAAWAIARGILRRFSSGSCNLPAAAFSAIVLILASRDLGVLFILPMIAGLAAAWLYMALRERPVIGWAERAVVVLFLIASVPLYYVLASGFLYLCAMCALFDLLVRKRPLFSVAWLASAVAVPYGMSYVYFEPDIAGRYSRWIMMPERGAVTTGLVAAMYLFVPAGAALAFLIGRFQRRATSQPVKAATAKPRKPKRRERQRREPTPAFGGTGSRIGSLLTSRTLRPARLVWCAVLALLAVRLVALRFDTSGWVYADYLRENGRFEEALASVAESRDHTEVARFVTLYALGQTGRLPWEMFHYLQVDSSDPLLLQDPMWDRLGLFADWRSDLYLELGRVNESQRWAHEALAMEGETPRVLERLALTYIIGGNPEAAKTFLRALEKVPFQAARARQFLAALDRDPDLRSDPLVARIRPLMLRKNYVGNWNTEQILQQSLEANPSNRLAFEYLLAHYLLTSDMKGFASVAPRLKDFYRDLPTHVQEALLTFKNLNDSLPPGVDGSAIDRQLEPRFANFVSLWARYQNGPPKDAWNALAPSFGDTWWFFYAFDRSAAGPPFEAGVAPSSGTGIPE